MQNIERLIAIEAIKRTKAKYFRHLDKKEWEDYARVFAPNAEMDMRLETKDEKNLIVGRENIARYVSQSVSELTTLHHGHMPEIEFTSETTADVIWAMEDKLWFRNQDPSRLFMHGYGHYQETYCKIGDDWLIQSLLLTRLRVDVNSDQ